MNIDHCVMMISATVGALCRLAPHATVKAALSYVLETWPTIERLSTTVDEAMAALEVSHEPTDHN